MERLKTIRDALLTVSDNVGHWKELKKEPPYIVWYEDSASGTKADNKLGEQAIQGTIHLFTATEYEPMVNDVQGALDSIDCAWYLNSIQDEEDTGWTHYEWVFEV